MYEVELKVRADHDALEERLAALGADHLGTVVQVDTYYDAPDRDFGETDEALRLRHTEHPDGVDVTDGADDASDVLTYKGPLIESESKTREEVEAGVDDGDAVDAVLQSTGFEPAATVRKVRDRYELDDYLVVLDDVEGLGEYVEVEAEADDASIEQVREGAIEVMERLGLDADDQIRTSYLGMVLDEERSGGSSENALK